MSFAGATSSQATTTKLFAKGVSVSDNERAAFVVCSVMAASSFRRSPRLAFVPVSISAEDATNREDQMATEENPGRVPSRILFTALICAGYVYVAFWLGFMIEGGFGHNG
jgi:hypothetical protein